MDVAQWIGNLLGQLPSWLFIPALIVLIVASVIVWYLFATAPGGAVIWPFKDKSEFLEKTATKKGKHGKK